MNVLIVATTERQAGGTFHARKLSSLVGADVLSAELPFYRIALQVLRSRADIIHFEVEYASYGTVLRTLVVLPLLVGLRRVRGPCVVTLHGVITRESVRDFPMPGLVLGAFRVSYSAVGSLASAVIVQSEAMREVLVSRYGLRRVLVIPHGSDPAPSIRQTQSPHRVAFFGFVRPSKGLEQLARAVSELREQFPDIRLVIAGGAAVPREASYIAELRNVVNQLGCSEQVDFRSGFVSDADKSSLVSSAGVLALPYTDYYVEVSGVVHDFMSHGVPVIVSDRPRFSELQDGVDCLKVQPDAEAIAWALRKLFDNPDLARTLAANLKAKAEAMSWDRVAEQHRRVYMKLIGGDEDPRSIQELVAAP